MTVCKEIDINGRKIGELHPSFIIAEIGINHNGDLKIAKKLIDVAKAAGCDAVKFQKRTPELCVPEKMKNMPRETPWGIITYLEYRKKIEFTEEKYGIINKYCRDKEILWFASCWDIPSVDFIRQFNTPCYKVASPCLTDHELLRMMKKTGKPLLISTGMSTIEEIKAAAEVLGEDYPWLLLHCVSTYPAIHREINLNVMQTLRKCFGCLVGYSGHEVGLQVTLAAVALGAVVVERHITLDRAMWGTDQAASVGPGGIQRLVRDIRIIEQAIGDGVKQVWESELPIRKRLRIQ